MNQLNLSEIRESYKNKGYYAPIPFLNEAEVTYYRGKLREIELYNKSEIKRLDALHLFFPWAYDLVTHPKLLDFMASILGPELLIHTSRIFRKPPNDPSFVSWHQDGRYTQLNALEAPTIWIALSDSKKENGCLRVVPYSFRQGVIAQIETYDPQNLLNHGQVAQVDIREEEVVNIELNAGEFSIHNVNLLHSSLPNDSPKERCGFSLTITTPALINAIGAVIQARGNAPLPGIEVWGRPEEQPVEKAMNALRDYHTSRNFPFRL